MKHVMIDVETLSTCPNAAIISIAAVEFDVVSGETGQEFYCVIDQQSCIDAGTIRWWMEQSEPARSIFFHKEPALISKALAGLYNFVKSLDPDIWVWSNPASFDCVIIRNAYTRILGADVPWNWRNERDLRTLVSLAPHIKAGTEFIGTPHNALDDCRHQIKYCAQTWMYLLKYV